jgi:hypothetical protein
MYTSLFPPIYIHQANHRQEQVAELKTSRTTLWTTPPPSTLASGTNNGAAVSFGVWNTRYFLTEFMYIFLDDRASCLLSKRLFGLESSSTVSTQILVTGDEL